MLPARLNPFANGRVIRELGFDPRWCQTDWDSLMTRLASQKWRGLVAGPHGSGKTTFLDALTLRLEQKGWRVSHVILNDEKTRLDPADWERLKARNSKKCFWLLDGAERLGSMGWRRFHRASSTLGGLVITDHDTGSTRLPRLLETRSTPAMLAAFVEKLAPELTFSPGQISRLYQESGGNLREALWRCYDHVAASTSTQQG